jgi:hypothetical protein
MKLPALNRPTPICFAAMPARLARVAGLTPGALGLSLALAFSGAPQAMAAAPEAIAEAASGAGAGVSSLAPPALAPAASALTLAGNRFEPSYTLGERQLLLNGGGIRSKMIIKIYAMALYLPAVQHDAQAVLHSDAPHSIQVVMLRDVDAERMAEGFGKAMLDMQPDAGKAALQARVATLSEAFHRHGDVHRGDALKFEYQPGIGTRVSIGGQAICPDIAGEDFNVAVKLLWLGEHASDERLKQALMGL